MTEAHRSQDQLLDIKLEGTLAGEEKDKYAWFSKQEPILYSSTAEDIYMALKRSVRVHLHVGDVEVSWAYEYPRQVKRPVN